ncbi:tyrosine-type recombinase/integrase [Burkholderia vietnamiensis]|jgi:site-specific recombinase XerD|uniref:Site-specific integrase n=1 Tax=Burkholderia contaminans TaxID=488447 RepID=A0AAP4RB02_9BURK|nr:MULTISPECIES: site-specific integrase [Burkholderia]HDR9756523.1 tyrosine-type recombinase/integrase [Burkholderia cepacia ATCC 25416]MBR7917465.1 tyrosine-type recombinase/integrase [Burkholderia vietnamiensis]MBR8055880.1 tyrosine-type recombinase/integrase [Burkholderia vietnamiensis]MDN7456272.1 site-specific integrase [Burkholderia cenocepacia]MDN7570245.1 site-specific integrase [Burkholderia contaminans]
MAEPTVNWDSVNPAAFVEWQRELVDGRGNPFSSQTLKQRASMYGKFLKFLYGRDEPASVLSVGPDEIQLFLSTLAGKREAGEGNATRKVAAERGTAQRYVRLINDVFEHLVDLGLREVNPAAALLVEFSKRTGDRSEAKLPECLDSMQDARLREKILSMPTNTWTGCRNRAMLALFAGAGLTLFEGIHIELENVDLTTERLVTPGTASGSRRAHVVPLARWCVEPLTTWIRCLEERGGEWRYLFPSSAGGGDPVPSDEPLAENSVYSLISAALEAVGFNGQDKGASVLRNTYALRNLMAGTNQNDLRSWMGLETDYQLFRIARLRGLWSAGDRRPV